MGNEESKARKIKEKSMDFSNQIQNNNQIENINSYNSNINSNNNNMQNPQNQPNTQNIQNQQNINENQNPLMQILNRAYGLFTEGNRLYQGFSFNEALFNYEEALKIANHFFPKIEDQQLKEKVDKFIKCLNNEIETTNFQIKNQFEYKKQAGFASIQDVKEKEMNYIEKLRKLAQGRQMKMMENTESTDKNDKYSENSKNTKSSNETTKGGKDSSTPTPNDNKVVTSDLRNKILTEIVDTKPNVKFEDIIGLEQAKQILREIIVLPNLRPDLFTGLRTPPRGLLLFGPPGVGKTMIAKAVATECACTFFNISASSLTSKYVGESEKLVRGLFELAFEKQPAVVFIDEMESILSKRSENENDASKRLKTEFLVQFDGVGSSQTARILIIGATNRPQELDSAVLRRLPKRVYIGPFNVEERKNFIKTLMNNNEHSISDEEFEYIAKFTNNYSNSDLKELCREAAYEPIREISDFSKITQVNKLRPTIYNDFTKAIKKVRGTLNDQMLSELENWNQQYGAIV